MSHKERCAVHPHLAGHADVKRSESLHQGLSVLLREGVTGELFASEERHGVDVLAYGPFPPATRARAGLDTGIHQVGGIAGLGGLHLVRVS